MNITEKNFKISQIVFFLLIFLFGVFVQYFFPDHRLSGATGSRASSSKSIEVRISTVVFGVILFVFEQRINCFKNISLILVFDPVKPFFLASGGRQKLKTFWSWVSQRVASAEILSQEYRRGAKFTPSRDARVRRYWAKARKRLGIGIIRFKFGWAV